MRGTTLSMLKEKSVMLIALMFLFQFIGCATIGDVGRTQSEYTYKWSNLNISVTDGILNIAGVITDGEGLPLGGKLIVFLPMTDGRPKMEKRDWGFTKSSIVNPSAESDLNGQFSIRVDLKSDFMKGMGEKFFLGVAHERGINFFMVEGKVVEFMRVGGVRDFMGGALYPVKDKMAIFEFKK